MYVPNCTASLPQQADLAHEEQIAEELVTNI
jgi:hypothetical protein